MTDLDTPDARHAWLWGATAMGLRFLGFPTSTAVAAAIAGVLILALPKTHRRDVILGGLIGAAAVYLGVRLLFTWVLGLLGNPQATGDAALLSIMAVGVVGGLLSGWSGQVVTLPGLRAFRILFLELCVLTGLLGGFFLLPSRQFTGAADAGGRVTFAAALVVLFTMIPAGIAHLIAARIARAVRPSPGGTPTPD